jgi:hypothetical protein
MQPKIAMKWTGNEETDRVLSLVDESETVILGQAIRDGSDWNGVNYTKVASPTEFVGTFITAWGAKAGVESAVSERIHSDE